VTTERRKVSSYELVDHGIENPQYFQGCGTSFTDFDEVVTGIGDNPAEAIDDALEAIAQGELNIDVEDLEARILADEGWSEFPDTPSAYSDTIDEVEAPDGMGESPYYFVSIRYSVADPDPS
jgi:hypothetical protein